MWPILVASLLLARCHAHGNLPDPACTPGAVATVDRAVVCGTSTRGRRHVSTATKRAVFEAYGLPWKDRGRYEVDHLISLELGGSNAQANLWPEPIAEAKEKDRAEDRLHALVCSGAMPTQEAQRRIAADWSTAVP